MPRINPYTHLRDTLDPITRRYGVYLAYELSPKEYVTTIEHDDIRGWLRGQGYSPQYLSAAKRHPDTDAVHWLSYAKTPDAHPPEVEGTALESWDPNQCQFHAHVFPNGDLFSHYELAPYLLPFDPKRLRGHYRPTWDKSYHEKHTWTYLRGVSDLVEPQ